MNEVFNELVVVKRSGQRVNFNGTKIAIAIKLAFDSVYENYDEQSVNKVYESVLKYIEDNYVGRKTINVEDIQDIIEQTLKLEKFDDVYNSFNNYRLKRTASREAFNVKQQHKFVKAIEKIGLTVKNEKKESPIEEILNFGKIVSNEFSKAYLLESKYSRAHEEGIIYIHDINYYASGTTSSSILDFNNIKDINDIVDIISNIKKEQNGEQVIPAIDCFLEKYVVKKFKEIFKNNLTKYLNLTDFINYINFRQTENDIDKLNKINFNIEIFNQYIRGNNIFNIFEKSYQDSFKELKEDITESFKRLLYKLNSLDLVINNNKVSVSLGSNTSYEGELITECFFKALETTKRTDNVLTIFKVDKNLDPKKSNYVYLENATKLLCDNKNINFSFNDNEYFSLGEKTICNDENKLGRMILSTTTINMARLGLKYRKNNMNLFYKELEEIIELTKNLLIQRYELQANKYKENFKYLFENNLLFESDKLEPNQKVRKVLRNGTLNVGIIGLKECVLSLLGIEEKDITVNDINLAFDILKFIREKIEKYTLENKINFNLVETCDKNISKELKAIDKSIYGIRKLDNEECYSTFNSLYKNLDINKQLSLNSKYQNLVSSQVVISIKNPSYKKIIEMIHNMSISDIKYGRIKLE